MSTNIEPLVSVIVPTYNRADYLIEAVESVCNQTYNNWELLIVDDGSTDNTVDVLVEYLKDDRIHYWHQDNQGQSVARQKALDNATGEYVAFLDSDNLWFPERLQLGVTELSKDSDIAVAYGDVTTIDENGNETSRTNMRRYSGRIAAQLLRDNFVTMNTSLVRRSAIDRVGGMRPTVRRADDYDLWLRMSALFKFIYIPEYMAEYRVMDDQISSNKDGRFSSNREIIENFHKEYPDAVSFGEKRRAWSSFFTRKAGYEASMKRYKSGLTDVFIALWQYPMWQGPWRVLIKMILLRF